MRRVFGRRTKLAKRRRWILAGSDEFAPQSRDMQRAHGFTLGSPNCRWLIPEVEQVYHQYNGKVNLGNSESRAHEFDALNTLY